MANKKDKKNYVSPHKTILGKIIIGILVFSMVAGVLVGLGFGIWQLISQV